uniref:Uncharacterized protein n=1 Tax=Trichogramma kaykai TaxID=54128 RepID=A0ABD2WTW0_9HYME
MLTGQSATYSHVVAPCALCKRSILALDDDDDERLRVPSIRTYVCTRIAGMRLENVRQTSSLHILALAVAGFRAWICQNWFGRILDDIGI